MRKYKLNRTHERKVPTDAMVNKHKDFDTLRAQYQDVVKRPKQPLYRNKKLFLFMLIFGLLTWLIVESIKERKESNEKTDATEKGIEK